MDEYIEGHSDGLQILRYNKTTAYTPHMDYLDDPKVGSFDYASAGTGGNRFATILLYMTDLGEHDGGETVFTEAWPPGVEETDRVPIFDAIKQLRESGDATELKRGSWEETMAATCRSKLSVRPHAARPRGGERFPVRRARGCAAGFHRGEQGAVDVVRGGARGEARVARGGEQGQGGGVLAVAPVVLAEAPAGDGEARGVLGVHQAAARARARGGGGQGGRGGGGG